METLEPTFLVLIIGLILAATFVPIIVIFSLVTWWLRRKMAATTREWEQEGAVFLRGPTGANFSGLESKGMGQIRGNGFIALTGQDLRITRAVPAAEWRIFHNQIKHVSLEASFLGKQRGMKVLVISFEQAGQSDRIGVYVRDGTVWIEAIANVAGLQQ